MTLSDEKAISKAIKEDALSSPIFIYGSEEYLKQHYLRRLRGHEKDAFSSFNDLRFDFTTMDMHLLADAVTTPPLMAARKYVLVYDIAPKEVSAEQLRQLQELLEDVPGDCRVVFLEKSGTVDDKRDEKSKKLLKLFDKLGVVLCLKERTAGDLIKLIKAEVEKRELKIAPEAAKQLLARAGRDITALKSETAKLCAYRQMGEITVEDVERLTVRQAEDNIYGLSRAILRDKYDEAMQILGDLCYLRYPEESILGTMASFFIDLYRARAAVRLSVDAAAIARDFGYGKRTFAVENALRDQKRLSDAYLSYALETLSSADIRLKSTGGNGRAILEETITALFLKERQKENAR